MNEDELLPPEAADLVIKIMQQNANNNAYVANQLMEGYKADYEHALRVISAIRRGVARLFVDGYMPTESAIMHALYPDVPKDWLS